MNRSEDRRPTISETSDQNELENQRAHTVYDQLADSQSGPLSMEQLVSDGLPERAVRHVLVDLEIKGYVESDIIEGTRVYSTISGEDNSE
jgi:DNA-binding transcriptional ArsR family regulator